MKSKPRFYYLMLFLIAMSFLLIGGDNSCDQTEKKGEIQNALSENQLPATKENIKLFQALQDEVSLVLDDPNDIDKAVVQLIKNNEAFLIGNQVVIFELAVDRIYQQADSGACRPQGATCSSDSQCCSGKCSGPPSYICTISSCRPAGVPCSSNSQCCSNNCAGGTCT